MCQADHDTVETESQNTSSSSAGAERQSANCQIEDEVQVHSAYDSTAE